MALTKVSGQVVKTNTDLTVGVLTATTATFTTVSVAGTITYDDVTNVDSVGLITARSGVNITSGGLIVTGISTVSAGTTSAPSISPSGDTNTGIFFPSADTIAFGEGGAEAARIDSNGRFGLGTSSPSVNLDVQAASARSKLVSTTGTNAAYHLFNNTGGNFYIGLDNSAGSDFAAAYAGAIWHGGAYPLIFGTSNVERLRITSAGLFGIGTNSPVSGAQLTVAGYGLAVTGQNFDHSANSIRIGEEGSGLAQIRCYGPNTSTNGSLKFTMSRSDGSNSQDVVIDGSGRLGIGTSTPSVGLHVSGATNTAAQIRSSNTTNSVDTVLVSETNGVLRTNTNHSLALGTNSTTALTIDTSQRVGIGTTSPSSLLHVSGNGGSGSITLSDPSNAVTATLTAQTTVLSMGTVTNHGIQLFTNSSERARIDTSGRLLVGTSSTSRSTLVQIVQTNQTATSGHGNLGIFTSNAQAADVGAKITLGGQSGEANWLYASLSGRSENNGYAGYLQFGTSDAAGNHSERMRITSNGYALIGTTTVAGSTGITLHPTGYIIAVPTYSLALSSSPRAMYMDSTGYFGYLSSTRNSKENIQLQSDVDWLYQLEPVTFNYKIKDRETGEYTGVEPDLQFGLIAEDVEAVCPDICFYDETENGKELRGIYYEKLITPMLKALQQANQRIEALEAEVATLKAQ